MKFTSTNSCQLNHHQPQPPPPLPSSLPSSCDSLERQSVTYLTPSSYLRENYGAHKTRLPLTLPMSTPIGSYGASSSILATPLHHLYTAGHRLHKSPTVGCRWAKSCGCCILIILGILILVTLSVVLGFSLYLAIVTNFLSKTSFVYSISGNFKVNSGDTFTIRLLNQTSQDFIKKSTRYNSIVSQLFSNHFDTLHFTQNKKKQI